LHLLEQNFEKYRQDQKCSDFFSFQAAELIDELQACLIAQSCRQNGLEEAPSILKSPKSALNVCFDDLSDLNSDSFRVLAKCKALFVSAKFAEALALSLANLCKSKCLLEKARLLLRLFRESKKIANEEKSAAAAHWRLAVLQRRNLVEQQRSQQVVSIAPNFRGSKVLVLLLA